MRTALALLAFACPAVALADAPAFHVDVPPGWVDLSPGAPEANFARLPEELVAQAKSGRFSQIAMDIDHAADGFGENFNVVVTEGRLGRISEGELDEIAAAVAGEMQKEAPGSSYRVVEKSVVVLGGAKSARLVADFDMNGLKMRQMAYLVPGPKSHAAITYTATPETFAAYRPAFEASAASVKGAAEPGFDWGGALSRAGRSAAVGAVIGLVVALFGLASRRRLKTKDLPAPPTDPST